ncbi:PREDICTED: NADH dehydrogenase [ubiquinone] 1 beta subcomplex subunit 6 [Crocodylus porosus]|uniref:NADH dehydrogenase [ubiquinone] 1 beta subcomplex subunit 6 n=1 Tax=Crocodylus porosus TaxID=8502 RepID=UPI00093C35B8|nr:PREDICTED: NADH dehydrogenase [ubiquinone] 1 beta subcomplex subunit 6 [Crocodylus porosus]
MSGYTPEEKLRLQQLRALRRRWLKDQELSPREPVLPPGWLGPVDAFWQRFLQPGGFWRHQAFRVYRGSVTALCFLVIPSWVIYYHMKYHLMNKPYGIVSSKPRIFPGDTILETGEVMPPLADETSGHH